MTNAKKRAPAVSAAEFPALTDFVRGYLHQDMADEYSSAEGAAQQFLRDADPQQRKAFTDEWMRFLRRMKGQSLESVNQALTRELGSACLLTQSDIDAISRTFR